MNSNLNENDVDKIGDMFELLLIYYREFLSKDELKEQFSELDFKIIQVVKEFEKIFYEPGLKYSKAMREEWTLIEACQDKYRVSPSGAKFVVQKINDLYLKTPSHPNAWENYLEGNELFFYDTAEDAENQIERLIGKDINNIQKNGYFKKG